MKKNIIVTLAIAAAVGVSVMAGNSQTLVLSGGSVVGSLTNQLTGSSPGYFGDDLGTVTSWVVSDNAQDSQGLIFVYQIVNNGPDSITSATFSDFSGAYVSAGDYSTITGTTLLGSYTPSSSGGFTYDTVTPAGAATFQDGSLPNSGGVSYFLVIDTDDNSDTSNYATTDDSFTTYGGILGPVNLTPVPEPPSSLLLLAGLACLFGFLRFRRVAGSNR